MHLKYNKNNSFNAVSLRFSLFLLMTFYSSIKCERIEVDLNDCRKLEVYYQCNITNLSIMDAQQEIQINIKQQPNDIRISHSNMSFIPKEFFQNLNNVKEFVAVNCSIKNIYYDTFVSAYKLHYLVLSHNNIEMIPDNAFRNVSDLQSLKLDNNEIEILTTNVFRGLNMLRTLKLSFNKIVYLPLYVFHDLENLEILDLSDNHIRIISAEQFITNQQLQQIDLNNNRMIIIDNGTFDVLTHIQQLKLENNVCVNASIVDNNITAISGFLKCCKTSLEEMRSCLDTKQSKLIENDDGDSNVSITIPIILILFASIFGNMVLIAYFFNYRVILDRFRNTSESIELVSSDLTASSYQVY